MGHRKVAVLNGGMDRWIHLRCPTASGVESHKSDPFQGAPKALSMIERDEVLKAPLIVDSREPDRYAGLFEKRDPKAGHIPGAKNRYFLENLDENMLFRERAELKEQFSALVGDVNPKEVVFYCGSGVMACHNILAMEHAGLGKARLYAGSWSDWSRQPDLPIATSEKS